MQSGRQHELAQQDIMTAMLAQAGAPSFWPVLICPSGACRRNLPDMPDLHWIADCPFLLNAKGTGGFADWEYETYSVETTSSGLSDVISLQSSDGGSPIPLDDPPRLESLQSFTSALSPFSGAAWASGDHRLQGARGDHFCSEMTHHVVLTCVK